MRRVSAYAVLCLGAAVAHIGSANNLPSSPRLVDTDNHAPGTGPYQLTPVVVRHDENDDPLVPEIPNEELYYGNDPFYLDDFEPRNIAAPAPDDSESSPSIDGGFGLAPKARRKRAAPRVGGIPKPSLPPPAPNPAATATDVSEEVAISEIGILVDDTKASLIPKICRSREFQPTMENYWVSGTDTFLRDYSRDNQGSTNYQKDGLFRSLAKMYLGEHTNLECSFRGGTFTGRKCKISCSDVLKCVNNPELGRKVYFSLAAAVGFSEVMGVMHDSFSLIPERLISMIGLMPQLEYTFGKLGVQDMLRSEAQFFLKSLHHAVVGAAPWHTVEKVSEGADASLARAKSDYDSAIQVYGMVEGGNDPYKWDKLFDPHYEMSISDLDLPHSDAAGYVLEDSSTSAEGWHGKTVERAKHVLLDLVAFIRSINSGELDMARESGYSVLESLFDRIGDSMGSGMDFLSAEVPQQVASRTKTGIAQAVEEILLGKSIDSDGSTNLSKLLSYGNYLPLGYKPNVSKLKNANPAEKLSKNIFMRLFNLSFEGKKHYISCTKDTQRRSTPKKDTPGPRSACERDNSGPQNLKACVEGYACYMYRWSERDLSYLSHNKSPKGMEKWDEPPFNISAEVSSATFLSLVHLLTGNYHPQNIITSSVQSLLQELGRGEGRGSLDEILKATEGGLISLGDPSIPGLFRLPVCFSRYNWNAQVTGWGILSDTDPNCPAKNFPCHCGPWGLETESVWREMGVGQGKKRGNYAQNLCPRQISRKVEDPVERYMAYCALDIRRNTFTTRVNGPFKYSGKDKYCVVFQGIIELKGYESIEDMDPEVKFAFACKIKKGGKGCSMYGRMFDGLWEEALDAGYLSPKNGPKKPS
ncbi:unnamed protein product [Tuber aestivum]|uniref:Uncharacterized protein n=1 Tax=Tuber aestivum TaxID=59557 RepID=A0A292PYK5_9PEZI|nr:unnamed protein product [Tuber aestivum]